ncbi:MAG: cytochrome P450 [Hyphomicrobiales bacterium]
MTETTMTGMRTGFYPPHVPPAAKAMSLPEIILKLGRNALLTLPEPVYREPIFVTSGLFDVAFLCDPELVKTVLLDGAERYPKDGYQKKLFAPLLGDSILTAEGESWRWQRRTAAPLFRRSDILNYVPTMAAAAEAAIETWRSAPAGTVHAIDKDMMRATFHVISHTILAGGGPGVRAAIEKGRADYFRGVNWWYLYIRFNLPHWMPRPGGRRMRAQERRLRAAVTDLIAERRPTAHQSDDILSRLISAVDPETGQTMSDVQLADNLLAFLLAGYDTTATALTWALYLLSQAPEWAARLEDEVRRVVPEGPVTAAHVDRLVTVQQVLKEAMRMYPPAPTMQRYALEDVQLGGVDIKAGTLLVIPIYAIHRHQGLWDDPNRFDPERFAPDREADYSRYQFMPFGGGPRICIGATFALVEATVILATLMRAARFDYAAAKAPMPVARMFLTPRDGMPMRVSLR